MAQARLLIRNGRLITAAENVQADILVEGEKIKEIGSGLDPRGAEVIDAFDRLVMPGGVDPHTHFDLPMFGTVSSDDHYTGPKAAAFGGTTTVIDFVPQETGHSLLSGLRSWQEKASRAPIDYSFHMNVTWLGEGILEELPKLRDEGVPSLKVFTAYNGRMRLQDGEIFQVFQVAAKADLMPMLHAENGDVIDILVAQALAEGKTSPEWHALTRPAWGEEEATTRAIALAAMAGSPLYVVHVTCAGALRAIREARQRRLPVMGETCPQYLFFSISELRRPDGAKWVCSPPLRTPEDNQALWQGLRQEWLQSVGTDHCAFFYDGTTPIVYEGKPVAIPGKELGQGDFTKIPNGLPGVEDRLPILWTYGVGQGRISPHQFVAMTATNPAKIFGLYPKKGTLEPGSDADIVIWNPSARKRVLAQAWHQRTDYNLYEDWELVGIPEKVFLRGRMIVDGERWLGQRGGGEFQARGAPQLI